MSLLNQIAGRVASAIARHLFTTTVVTNNTSPESRSELMEFLRELEFRAAACTSANANHRYFSSMTTIMRKQLMVAVIDWNQFCKDYTCIIAHNGKFLQSAKDFRITIKEKNCEAPKHWEAKFSNFTY